MARKKTYYYDNLKKFESLLGLPILKEAHDKWIVGLEYQDLQNIDDLYEKEVDDLALKLLKIRDEARCQHVIHTIILNTPEIVRALLYERYITILNLFKRFDEPTSKANIVPFGCALYGMLCLYNNFMYVTRCNKEI